ncbi:MAG: HAD family hydrolase [Emcibacteraceae bacterium]|nr:HAD family hydrolase [Emcibacteraceae bacterium]
MSFDLIIFDCDGVLVDSETLANVLLRDALAEHGLDMTVEEVVATYVGRSMTAVVTISEEMLGKKLPSDFLDQLQVKTFALFDEKLQAVAGVEDVLKELQNRNIDFCVASSGSFDKMDKTLGITGLRDYFGNRIYNSSQVKRGKPYPDLYLYAADQMLVEPARCLVIEDSLPGVQGGVAAGMEVMAYSVRGEDQSFKNAGGLVFKDMAKILEHIS